jgi:hypothetical protein
MPTFDSGRCFFTALIPVRSDPCQDPRSTGHVTSHVHVLREVLAAMPTALQTPATEKIGLNSPFARCGRTHFARFAVLDDVAYNGRVHVDAIRAALLGPDPTSFETVDHLADPYLIFVADVDAPGGTEAELESWLAGLWQVMEPELRAILEHCHGYDRVDGAAGFAKLMRACQVETTMPFNDYWTGPPPLQGIELKPFLYGAAGAAAAIVLGLLGGVVLDDGWLWLSLLGLVALGGVATFAYLRTMRDGEKPFPMAPRSDLQSVLKALYLQQHFTRFAIDHQGADAATLNARFGQFLARHRPDDPAAPTQPRGVVASPRESL